MINLLNNIRFCEKCSLSLLRLNKYDKLLGYGKLNPFYKGDYVNKIMLVGLNPSYRRYPGIHRAFGGDIPHKGTGYDFTKLLSSLELLEICNDDSSCDYYIVSGKEKICIGSSNDIGDEIEIDFGLKHT